jgi:hypothetical protein
MAAGWALLRREKRRTRVTTATTERNITEHEAAQIERANASSATPDATTRRRSTATAQSR